MRLVSLLVGAAAALGPCDLRNDRRLNVFMAFTADVVQDSHLATLESVFYQYPSANVVILTDKADVGFSRFVDSLSRKDYCLSVQHVACDDASAVFITVQFQIYELQFESGGLYVPFDGALLNTLEYILPPAVSKHKSPVFQEVIHARNDGFDNADFGKYAWKRPHNDIRENSTFPCAVHCLRYISAGWLGAPLFLEEVKKKGHPDVVLTTVLKSVGLEKVTMLPFWLITEAKFPDHWHTFGSSPGFTDSSTDLFAPRNKRYREDYWLVVSHKLWLPWFMALPEETNVFDLSVVSLVRQQMSLNLFTPPFLPLLGSVDALHTHTHLKSPYDQIERLMTAEQILMRKDFDFREIGLPGNRGGYRTFGNLRVVSHSLTVHVVVQFDSALVNIVCEGVQLSDECEKHISRDRTRFEVCGSPAYVNSLLHVLRYDASSSTIDFADVVVTVGESCDFELLETEKRFSALIANDTESVTVVAHSANRCDSLRHMIQSVHDVYPGMLVMVTCERDRALPNEPDGSYLENTGNENVEWYSVPFDFGLSRGKAFLASKVTTEFVMVLDDDFRLTYSSCIECLMWRMQSRIHSALLPLDVIGFPILEDERAFGAFRGSLLVSNSRFSIEPHVHSSSADGCARVDICPMVFLARTERLRTFKWSSELPVGEHELFFASNQYHGIQVAVCSDVSFTHFRIPPSEMPTDYPDRRGRQRELMTAAFSKIGIGQTHYFFHKYSHQDEGDFESLLSKRVNPYSIRSDGGDSVDISVGPFRFCYIAVISNRADWRHLHRQSGSVLSQLKSTGTCSVIFFVPAHLRSDPVVVEEIATHKDIVLTSDGKNKSKLVFETMRRFMFHYMFVVGETTAFSVEDLSKALDASPGRSMKVFRGEGFRGISRDLHYLLSHPMILKHLMSNGDTLQDIDKWVSTFAHTSQELRTSSLVSE